MAHPTMEDADELCIGGNNLTVKLRDDHLYAEVQTGNKQWIAVLTGKHPEYTYDREFAAHQRGNTSERDSGTVTIDEGDMIEYVSYTHSGKNRSDNYYLVKSDEVVEIDESEVQERLDDWEDPAEDLPDNSVTVTTTGGFLSEAEYECPYCGEHRSVADNPDDTDEMISEKIERQQCKSTHAHIPARAVTVQRDD